MPVHGSIIAQEFPPNDSGLKCRPLTSEPPRGVAMDTLHDLAALIEFEWNSRTA